MGMEEITSAQAALSSARKIAGGNAGIARAIGGITPQAVSQWRRVPAERVIDVERISGVSRHELRPDIYPIESNSEPASGEDAQ